MTHRLMKDITDMRRFVAIGLVLAAGIGAARAAEVIVSSEATVQGGTSSNLNLDEVTAGYIHVKYHAPLDLARKAYFQFDLAGSTPDTNAPASLTVKFTSTNKQRVQLWALNQAYPGFTSAVTWNTAQANDTASNGLLTTGPFTATAIGADVLIPTSGTTPHTFTIPRLGDVLISNRVTLVLAGVDDASNSSGGLRMQRANAALSFSLMNGQVPPVFSSIGPQTIQTGESTGLIPFTLTDDLDSAASLNPFAVSSDPTVIPAGNIVLGGSGSNRTVTVTAGSQPGTATITLYAVDSQSLTGSTAFAVTVISPPPPDTNHYDVYLAGGQSNMDGRGSASDLTGDLVVWNQPQSDVRIWYANPVNLDPANPTYSTGWQTLAPGFSVAPGFTGNLPSTRFGPELAFARTVADADTNRRIAIIKVSQGGTSLSSDWRPASGYMYTTFTNIARTALQSLTNSGARYTLRGMIWHQGESDGSSSTATYEARLTEFIAAVRGNFGVANLPLVVGELATNRSVTVRQAQFNVAQNIPYVGFASSSNLVTLSPDDPHFNSAGALIMGQRMADALEIPPIRFTGLARGTNSLTLTASGLALASCRLLSTTNLTLPRTQWTVTATSAFDGGGAVGFTNAMTMDAPGKYYVIAAD